MLRRRLEPRLGGPIACTRIRLAPAAFPPGVEQKRGHADAAERSGFANGASVKPYRTASAPARSVAEFPEALDRGRQVLRLLVERVEYARRHFAVAAEILDSI